MFANRKEAGKELAQKLEPYRGHDAVVYALPRGGVVLGYEVANALHLPLDLTIARKIGHPQNPEYAVCAVTEDGTLFCNETERALLSAKWLSKASEREQKEAKRRRELYLADRQHLLASGKTAIIVDDGIATGLTIHAALESLKKERPAKIVVAVPVAPQDAVRELKRIANEVIVLVSPDQFLGAVGAHYRNFPQVSDDEVIRILRGYTK